MTKVHIFAAGLLLFLLPACCAQRRTKIVPETGLLSFDRYTNEFFGFSLPLPADPKLGIAELGPDGMWHPLFGLGEEKSQSAFIISAMPVAERDAWVLMDVYSATGPQPVIQTYSIAGQEFAIGIAQPDKHHKNGLHRARYVTFVDSYLLKFEIRSLDAMTAKDLEHCVEQIQFFDPAKAKEIAGPNGKPYNPLAQSKQ